MSIISSQCLRVIRYSTHQKLHLVQRCVLKLQLRKTPTRLYIYTNCSKPVKCPISTICKVMVWVQMIRILPCPSVYCIGYWPALPSIPLVQRLGGPLLLLSLSVCLSVIFFLFSNSNSGSPETASATCFYIGQNLIYVEVWILLFFSASSSPIVLYWYYNFHNAH